MIAGLAAMLALPVLGQSTNTTSTVVFSLRTMSGAFQGRELTISPNSLPEIEEMDIFWGPDVTAWPSNGVCSVPLAPDSYTVSLAGAAGSFDINVLTNGMTYQAWQISTNLVSYPGGSNGPATVTFPVLSMTGSGAGRALSIAPIIDPVLDGTNICWGAPLSVTPTNGLATTKLEPNGFAVTVPGLEGEMVIYVPTDGGTYNAATLPSVMPTNSPLPSLNTNQVWFSGLPSTTTAGGYTFNTGQDNGVAWEWSGSAYVSVESGSSYSETNGAWTIVGYNRGYPITFRWAQTNAAPAPFSWGEYDASVVYGTNAP